MTSTTFAPTASSFRSRMPQPKLFDVVELCYSKTRGMLDPRTFATYLNIEVENPLTLPTVEDQINYRRTQGFYAPNPENPTSMIDRKGNRVVFDYTPTKFDIVVPDGLFTIVPANPKFKDEEYTFKINTPTQGKMEGKRLISVHTGTNLLTDYTSEWSTLGWIRPDIFIWSRTLQQAPDTRIAMSIPHMFDLIRMSDDLWLEATRQFATRSNRCFRCGHKLIRSGSILKSVGPDCEKKLLKTNPEIFDKIKS